MKKYVKIVLSLAIIFTANVALAGAGADFHLAKNIYIKQNTYVSPVISFKEPMDRAVLSWNATTPGKSSIELRLRARAGKNGWSNWFTMGVWGEGIKSHSVTGQDNKFGKVDIDTLELKEAAKDWQYRIIVHRNGSKELPSIDSIGLTVKNSKSFKKEFAREGIKSKPLKVPAISQFEYANAAGKPDLGKRICSPTSVTMLLEYNGLKDLSPIDIAKRVYDSGADAYGNWPFNTAAMYDLLHDAQPDKPFTTYVRWYESFDELMDNVANGTPVIVSVGFKEGELKGAPKPTPGHLVLVRGADKKYVYVNDPAAPDRRSVPRRYLKDEFVKAWKGVAYIMDERQ
jgi:uncharacterized protein YvpB